MAGDWIPMRIDLADDPAVIAMTAMLAATDRPWVTPQLVVGCWHSLWSWANQQLRDGNAPGVTDVWVDARVNLPGFARAAQRAGWLVFEDGVMRVPNWDHWNSKSAKKRLLTARRVSECRLRKCNAGDVTESLPEKRREESKNLPLTPPLEGGGTPVAHPHASRAERKAAERHRKLAAAAVAFRMPETIKP